MTERTETFDYEPVAAGAACTLCTFRVPDRQGAKGVDELAHAHAIETRHPVQIVRTVRYKVRRVDPPAEG